MQINSRDSLFNITPGRLTAGVSILFILPLMILATLHYRSLIKVREENQRATRANMSQYLDIAVKNCELIYKSQAERLLNLPNHAFTPNPDAALAYFQTIPAREARGVRYFIFINFVDEEKVGVHFYDPQTRDWLPNQVNAFRRSVALVGVHWFLREHKGFPVPADLETNHDLPNQPVVVKVTADEAGRALGIQGMVLDPDYFAQHHLPRVLTQTLAATLPGIGLSAVVNDQEGVIRYQMGKTQTGEGPVLDTKFRFVFTNWTLTLQMPATQTGADRELALSLGLALVLCLVIVIGIAVTLRAMIQQARLSQMKSEFVANVSHELRTPLASIRLFGEMMRSGKIADPDRIRDYGGAIELETNRLTRLIENILDFDRMESGRMEYQAAPFDIAALVGGLVEVFRHRPDLGGVTFEMTIPAQVPVIADEAALGQAVFNLLDNAVKYGPARQIVRVVVDERGDKVHISIQDQGDGIPPEEQERVFERFHRVGTGAIHKVRGNGLGLTIARHIARGHGGDIHLESSPGRGCRFDFHIMRGRHE